MLKRFKKSMKALTAFFVVFALLAGMIQMPLVGTVNAAESSPAERYFYKQFKENEQLGKNAKPIYDAMYEMWQDGIFAKGEDYDLTEHGKVSNELLVDAINGGSTYLDAYGAARDAFQYDYPDVFYVDWSLLSVRIVSDSKGNLHGILGAGRSSTYLLSPFTAANIPDAIEKYEAKIKGILNGLPTEASGESKSLAGEQAIYIHDYITKNMIYRFENEVTNKNCNARTAYDALIYGEGVCEAYTRGFKALMDRANIPTVCIYGGYRSSDTVNEPHIWNAVQIDGKWYGMDVTQDDPKNKKWTDKNSGHETHTFCLVGELDLNAHHLPSGVMSSANYEFRYPTLERKSLRERSFYVNGDLKVKLEEDYYNEGDGSEELHSGTYCVSYRGKNYTQNAEDGYYILTRYGTYDTKEDTWTYTGWSYIEPKLYGSPEQLEPAKPDSDMIPEGASGSEYGEGHYVCLPLPQVMRAQFAVTTTPPTFKYDPDPETESNISGSLYYEGDASLLTVVSEEIDNKWGTYKKPPYPKSVDPAMTSIMKIGSTYPVTIVFDEELKKVDASIGYEIEQIGYYDNKTGEDHSKVENIKWDGARTVTFDFTPSKQYADHNTIYNISLTGLVGKSSEKRPVAITYGVSFPTSFCGLRCDGFNWHIFGQPQLMDTADMDTSKWEAVDTETGETIKNVDLDKITHRLTLVSSEPTSSRSKEMLDALDKSEYGDEEVISYKMYNIQLALCKAMIVKTGEAIRVCIGFPEGCTYEDLIKKGTTYKAYHYKVDPATDKLTGEVEEIKCLVTEYGLIIECSAFSPFALVEVKGDIPEAKTVVLSSTEHGGFYDGSTKLEGAKGTFDLEKNQTGDKAKKVTIKADEGYEIDSVIVGGKRQLLGGDVTEYDFSLDYKDYKNGAVIVTAEFVAEEVHAKDAENGFSSDFEVPDNDSDDWKKDEPAAEETSAADVKVTGVKVHPASATLTVGKTKTLKATVSPSKATNKAVTWTSSNKKVAKVNSKGKVTAMAVGTATITATTKDGKFKAKVKVAVKPKNASFTLIGKKRSVVIKYKKVKGVSGYQVYRSKSKSKGFKKITTRKQAKNGKYTSVGLSKKTTYYYKIRTYKIVKGKKVYSSFSAVKKVKTK